MPVPPHPTTLTDEQKGANAGFHDWCQQNGWPHGQEFVNWSLARQKSCVTHMLKVIESQQPKAEIEGAAV